MRGQKTEEREQKTEARDNRLEVRTQNRFDACDLDALTETDQRTPISEGLFKCGVGVSQAAITPSGELKMCLMVDYPKYKILDAKDRRQKLGQRKSQRAKEPKNRGTNLKDAWEELKQLVVSIKPDKDYKCERCELEPYCKWCPARGWLENRNFTSCEPESRRWAEIRRERLENKMNTFS